MAASDTQARTSWETLIGQTAPALAPIREGAILSGQGADDVPVRVSSLEYKGYIEMWDTRTGALNLCPQWFWWQAAKLQQADGTLMYTRTNPHIAPNYGEDLVCPLNPLAPSYADIAGMGFKPCRKRHIPNQAAVEAHVLHSHGRAHTAMATRRSEQHRAEDRALQVEAVRSQQEFMRVLMAQIVGAPAQAAGPPPPKRSHQRGGNSRPRESGPGG